MTTLRKELPYILIALIPFIYLAFIWNQLPETIPIHWNGKGEIDGYGSKIDLLGTVAMLNGLGYFLILVFPKIDPKGKLNGMGHKLNQIRILLTIFMSALSIYIIYNTQQTESKPTIAFALIGLLFAGLGNYFKTIKPNYFIGIKTPWTLENEEVWKKTHLFGGKLWFIGGLLIFILSLIIPDNYSFYVLITVTVIISILPIIYSYLEFKKLKA
ncbi:MAG: SdpI family protein [Flavobacterium haoranii]